MKEFNVVQLISIKMFSIISAWMIKIFWLGRIEGLHNIPAKPCIIISNHASYLDFLLLGYIFKRTTNIRFRFWAKTKVTKHFLWKIYSNIFHSIEVNENGNFRKLNELSLEALNNGEYVCIFPEGKRSRNGDLQEFKVGYLRLALSAGIDVVPVFLENTFEAWPTHKSFPKPKRCNITFHPTFKISKDLTETEINEVNSMIRRKYEEFKKESIKN
jgi:long-chain acyl-CoA synthetase